MTQRAAIVQYGDYSLAWGLDLPGCTGGGDSEGAALAALRDSMAEYEVWLRERGDEAPVSRDVVVAERVDAVDHAATGGEFLFEADLAPMSEAELERGITLLSYTHADVLRATAHLTDAVLDWEPPDWSIEDADAWAPEGRTIRQIATHVTQLEIYYRDGLRDGPARGIFEQADDPSAERGRTVALLRALSPEDRSRVFHPVRPGRTAPDAWTARKLIRRALSHERVHAMEMVQRRTWLLLGAPKLRR